MKYGIDVMKHLVNVHTIPVGVIIVTGHDELLTVEAFYSLGTSTVVASDYMVKPFLPERLLHEVERTAAQIQAKRLHIKESAADELKDSIIARLDKIEADPAFQEMMQRSDEDIRTGRVVSHEEVKRRLRRKHGKKR